MKRMHTEQEIKELAQEQITQSPTVAEIQAKIAAIEADKANVFEFEGGVEDLDADALMALYESKAQIIKFVTELDTIFYCDVFTSLEMRFFNLSQNNYTYFEAERTATDSPWYVGDVVEETLLVDGNVDLNGDFTANSIIENMSGYSFVSKYSGSTYNIDPTYIGVVKNGNKITFCVAFTIERTSDTIDNYYPNLARIEIPQAIYNKLVASIGGLIDIRSTPLVKSDTDNSPTAKYAHMLKVGNNIIEIQLSHPHNLTIDTTYYGRYEGTFLLSENLAPTNP